MKIKLSQFFAKVEAFVEKAGEDAAGVAEVVGKDVLVLADIPVEMAKAITALKSKDFGDVISAGEEIVSDFKELWDSGKQIVQAVKGSESPVAASKTDEPK